MDEGGVLQGGLRDEGIRGEIGVTGGWRCLEMDGGWWEDGRKEFFKAQSSGGFSMWTNGKKKKRKSKSLSQAATSVDVTSKPM